jgi:hypothetical protein
MGAPISHKSVTWVPPASRKVEESLDSLLWPGLSLAES